MGEGGRHKYLYQAGTVEHLCLLSLIQPDRRSKQQGEQIKGGRESREFRGCEREKHLGLGVDVTWGLFRRGQQELKGGKETLSETAASTPGVAVFPLRAVRPFQTYYCAISL